MNLQERLNSIFQSVFVDDELSLADTMTADDIDGWDSVTHINLMFAIEQEFGFQFSGNELAEFANVGELKEFLAHRLD